MREMTDRQVDGLLAAIGMEDILTRIEGGDPPERIFPELSPGKAWGLYDPLKRAVDRLGVDEVLDRIIDMRRVLA